MVYSCSWDAIHFSCSQILFVHPSRVRSNYFSALFVFLRIFFTNDMGSVLYEITPGEMTASIDCDLSCR